jgi:probable HAF family extracellular repeat protein
MNPFPFGRTGFSLSVCFLLALSGTAASQTYTITDLGTLGGSSSGARGVNASGQITGYASISTTNSSAFLYGGTKMTSLGTLGGTTSIGLSINVSGQVAGYSTLLDGDYNAFFYNGEKLVDVGYLACCYSDAEGINDSGQVTGASSTADGDIHPYLYTNGQLADLGTLGGEGSGQWNTGEAVSNAGDVVGYTWTAQGDFRGFLYSEGKMVDLGTLGGPYSQAFAINDQGQVTGQAYIDGGVGADAFLYEGGVMHDLGTITGAHGGSGQYSCGFGINNSGVIVGESTFQTHPTYIVYHAFVYSDGKMRDLNKLIPAGSGWVLSTAYGVNDAGQIVGYGTYKNQERAFLLTPR